MLTFRELSNAFNTHLFGIIVNARSPRVKSITLKLNTTPTTEYSFETTDQYNIVNPTTEVINRVVNRITERIADFTTSAGGVSYTVDIVSEHGNITIFAEIDISTVAKGVSYNTHNTEVTVCLDIYGQAIAPNLNTKLAGGFLVSDVSEEVYEVLVYDKK